LIDMIDLWALGVGAGQSLKSLIYKPADHFAAPVIFRTCYPERPAFRSGTATADRAL
jgi:hypothetical protein